MRKNLHDLLWYVVEAVIDRVVWRSSKEEVDALIGMGLNARLRGTQWIQHTLTRIEGTIREEVANTVELWENH